MRIPTDWSFASAEIAAGFDAHVREQLPWYDLATGLVVHCARHFLPISGRVLDVGASTGNVGRALAPLLEARGAHLLAIDSAEEMREHYRAPGELRIADVRGLADADLAADFTVAFLALMFVPVADRRRVIDRLVANLRPGGACLVFDKALPLGGYAGTVLSRLALAAKFEAGAAPAEIIAKELSLAGVQRPLSPAELGGFVEIFRFGDFGGWLYQAPDE